MWVKEFICVNDRCEEKYYGPHATQALDMIVQNEQATALNMDKHFVSRNPCFHTVKKKKKKKKLEQEQEQEQQEQEQGEDLLPSYVRIQWILTKAC